MFELLISIVGVAMGLACAAIGNQEHDSLKPNRAAYEHEGIIGAPAATIWPLLCPVREAEWIPGWRAEILYSESGVAENNCIFRTDHAGRQLTWVVSRFEPADGILEFVVTADDMVMKLDIRLTDRGDGTSALRWRRTMTGIRAVGIEYVRSQYTRDQFMRDTELIMRRLDHYCRTGRMLTEDRH